MILNNFILEEYDKNNVEHNNVLKKLGNDLKTQRYLGDLKIFYEFLFQNKKNGLLSNFYIAYFHYDAIGIITINEYTCSFELAYAILPEYRRQNFGVLLLKEFSLELLKRFGRINKLTLRINTNNIGSRKVALLAGYERDLGSRYCLKRK